MNVDFYYSRAWYTSVQAYTTTFVCTLLRLLFRGNTASCRVFTPRRYLQATPGKAFPRSVLRTKTIVAIPDGTTSRVNTLKATASLSSCSRHAFTAPTSDYFSQTCLYNRPPGGSHTLPYLRGSPIWEAFFRAGITENHVVSTSYA